MSNQKVVTKARKCAECGVVLPNPKNKYCSPKCIKMAFRVPEYYIDCPECGETFYSNGKNGRLKYCSRSCYVSARTGKKIKNPWSPPVEKKCRVCEKTFMVAQADVKRGKGIYCSANCRVESQKNGKVVGCSNCGKEVYAPANKFEKYNDIYCSRECSWEGLKTGGDKHCLHCGKKFYLPDCLYDKRRYCSPICAKRATGNETRIEAETRKALESLGINYIQEWKPKGVNRFYDFKVGNVVIEVNGEYWHGLPGAKERDEEKRSIARKRGLTPVTFWGKEIDKHGATHLIENRVIPLLRVGGL